MAACGGSEPPPDPRAILEASFAAMDDLESFHFEIRIESPTPTNGSQDDTAFPPITLVGEFQVPDRFRIATSGFLEMETIAIGRTQYRRMGGPWGAGELDEDDQPSMIARPWTVLQPLQPEALEYLGEVTVDGMRTHHLRSRYSEVFFPDENGEGELTLEVWIGVEDGLWRRMQTEVDAEGTEGTVTSVLEFSAFGEPVAIDHPDEWWPLVRDLRWTPSEPVPGQPFAVTMVAENHGGVPLNTTIEVVVDGATIRTLPITDLAPGASQDFEFKLTLERGTHNFQAGGSNLVIEVFDESERSIRRPSFGQQLRLSVSPLSVLPGQPVTIAFTPEAGDAVLVREVEISISGQFLRTFLISEMPPGSSQTFSVEVITSEPGRYQAEAISQSGYFGVPFTVIGSPPPGFRLSVHQGAEKLGGGELPLTDVLGSGEARRPQFLGRTLPFVPGGDVQLPANLPGE